MDPLLVAGAVGEGVDALLVHRNPVRDAKLFAHEIANGCERIAFQCHVAILLVSTAAPSPHRRGWPKAGRGPPATHTNALKPVTARPTLSVFLSRVPSYE